MGRYRNAMPKSALSAEQKAEIKEAFGFEPSNAEISKMVQDLDIDGNATIEFDEFVEMMEGKMNDKDMNEEMKKAFKLYDADGTGKIRFKDLKRVAQELGEAMQDAEIQEIIDEADRDGDGAIDEGEFLRVMKKQGLC